MRRLLALLLLVSAASAREAGTDVEGRAFLEMETARTTRFVSERVAIRLRVGVDRRFFDSSLVPIFRRRMDLQVRLDAPWTEELDGALVLAPPEPAGGDRLSFALNDRVVEAAREADRVVDGRTFQVFRIDRTLLPERPGTIEIPAPVLRFAWATRFEEDFVKGRSPVDRRDAAIRGEPLTLLVRALPEEGKPPGFSGAVGRFTVSADAARREVGVGESFRLALGIEGEGNLAHFGTPKLGGVSGFHVYGEIDDRATPRRTVTYDLAATSADLTEVPAIPFPFFDPEPPGRYRVARTEPIPIVVRGGAPAPAPEPRAPAGERARGRTLPTLITVVGIATLLVAAVVYVRARRARVPDEPEPGPADLFLARVEAPGADLEAALVAYLAVWLDCEPAAVIAPDLRERMVRAGVPEDLAGRTARFMERLVASRYGGDRSDAGATATARTLVTELEPAFVRYGGGVESPE